MDIQQTEKPWEYLEELIAAKDAARIRSFLDSTNPADTALAISRIDDDLVNDLMILLSPEDAAELIEDLPDTQAAEIMEDLEPSQAAAIFEELDSDHVVDILGEMDDDDANAIIGQMNAEDAEEARQFLTYDEDTAGGLMISEFLDYRSNQTVQDVLDDLQANREEYAEYDVQYIYITDNTGQLEGVLRMRDLLFPQRLTTLGKLMIRNPYKIIVTAPLDELRNFFEEHNLFGAPVVDQDNRLVGIVLPEAVEDAKQKKSVNQFLGLSGIIGGEEFRSMPLAVRAGRRFSWLSLNIFLNIIAASIIALYQDTIAAVIALAVFLPIVSDMSGNSGQQAAAVSMRELTLGLLRPHELGRVIIKESSVGILNGIGLGLLLGGLVYFWQGNLVLGMVIGLALALNTVLSVLVGGLTPLLLKMLKLDPALVTGALITTITDMGGFFLVLSFATIVLDKL
ncbi:MAG: magnesium transporter [Pelovirga sp.]